MKTIVLASNNVHKIEEFKRIMKDYKILSMKDIGFLDDIVEDGETLLENAFIKAKTVSLYLREKKLDYPVVSDDTGLFVPSIGGEPGIYSARYAGDHDSQKNRDKLRMKIKGKDPSAYFLCQIVYYPMNGEYFECSGRVDGKILDEEIGKKDFGYDCIFYSNELKKTFGEASEDEKNKVSHRGRAIVELLNYLK
ncbi:MAG: RdgB/HAM1 family non-canonical purine NTP pyrophosphatase [Bacilli bacterium]|nr:RdgB/HAM1 family non-canonical purine NTP pyrophosphatase [Bacilli bacterium]